MFLRKNKRFIGLHSNETCYIFGNGRSLKYYDLNFFNDKVAIGLNHIGLHKDCIKLNIKYIVVPESLFMYPVLKNPYNNKLQKNVMFDIFKSSVKNLNNITIFTSVTNIFGWGLKNLHYLYNFGIKNCNIKHCNIAGEFSYMRGALYSGLGMAIAMGFQKAILVGCDHLHTPSCGGHFYTYGKPIYESGQLEENMYEELLASISKKIEITVLTNDQESLWLNSMTYEQYTNQKMSYRENTEIVEEKNLIKLYEAYKLGQIRNSVFKP